MTPAIVTLILNLVLLFFVLINCLSGLRRGVKKQALWLGFFVGAVVLAFIFTPLITSGIIGINISVEGESLSIRDYLLKLITENKTVGDLYNQGPAIRDTINNLPLMIANLAVYLIVLYLFIFVMWIAYLITAKFVFRKKENIGGKVYTIKKGQAVELVDQKPKKHRLWGSLVGAVQGVLFCFFTLVPLSGLVSTYMDASNAKVVVAAEDDETSAVQKFIDKNIPKEYQEYIKAYDGSIISVLGGAIKLDDLCFNGLATTKVNGNRVTLRNEIITFAEVYDCVDFLVGIDFNNIDWKTFNYKKLNKAVDLMFDSEIFRSLTAELIPYAIDYAIDHGMFDDTNYKDEAIIFCKALKAGYSPEFLADADNLKSDLKSLLGIVETLGTSGLMDEIIKEEKDVYTILDLLVADDCKNLNDIVNNIFTAQSTKSVLIGSINVMLSTVEKSLPEGTDLDRIDFDKVDWSQSRTEINTIVTNMADIYNDFKNSGVTLEMIKEDYKNYFKTTYSTSIPKLMKIINVASSSNLFTKTEKGTNIFDNILDSIKTKEIGTYIDLDTFKSDKHFSWENEATLFKRLVDAVKDFTTCEKYKDVDYAAHEITLGMLFDSPLAGSIKMDALDKFEELIGGKGETTETTLQDVMTDMFAELKKKEKFTDLKTDALAVFRIVKNCGQSDVLDQFKAGEVNFTELVKNLDKLDGEKHIYENIISDFMSSNALRQGLPNTMNILIESLEKSLEVELSSVQKREENWDGWTQMESGLNAFFKNIADVVKTYDGADISFDTNMLDKNFITSLNSLGGALDAFATLPIWQVTTSEGNSNIYDEIVLALQEKPLGEYIDFSVATLSSFQDGKFWQPELEAYKNSFDRLISKKIGSGETEKNLLSALISGDDATEVIKKLSVVDTTGGETTIVNDVDTIFKPILERKLFKKLALTIIDQINFEVEKITDDTVTEETSTMTKIDKNVKLELQSEDILAVMKEAIVVLNIAEPEIKDYKPLLSALEVNAKKIYKVNESDASGDEGVFKQAYVKLEIYVNKELKKSITDNFGLTEGSLDGIGDIPLDTIIDLADAATNVVNKISDGTVTSDDINKLVDELAKEETRELVDKVTEKNGVISGSISDDVKNEVGQYIEENSTGEDASISPELKAKLKKLLGLGA